MTLESASEARLRTAVEAAGGMCVKIAPVDAGAPDRMVLYQGQIHLVELKQSGGRLRPVQRAWHSRAAQAGVTVDVVYGQEGVDAWIMEHDVAPLPRAREARDLTQSLPNRDLRARSVRPGRK